MVEFFVPAMTHEDTRFYTLGRGGFLKRATYALSRVVVTTVRLRKRGLQFERDRRFGRCFRLVQSLLPLP